MKKIFANLLPYFLSLLLIFIIWEILSCKIDSQLILPSPVSVFQTLFILLGTGLFWKNFLFSFLRIIYSFLISVFLGGIIGCVCGLNDFSNRFFKIPLAFIRVCPVVSLILVIMFWFKSGVMPVVVAVLMTLPVMVTAIQKGFNSKDENLYEMAQVFKFSRFRRFIYLDLYTIRNSFLAGCVSCFGISWKVCIAGEVLGLPKIGLGTFLQKQSVHLETPSVMATTIFIVLVSFVLETVFSLLINKLCNQGRDS